MTQLGEGIAITMPVSEEEKYFRAEILQVEFPEAFKAMRNRASISMPHWPAAADGIGQTQKAAVLPIGKSNQKVKVKIKITSKGYSGNGKLLGILQGFEFEGSVPLGSGEHTVQVTMNDPPDSLRWLKGEIFWGVEASDVCVPAGRTAVELFFVFDDPSKLVFFSRGVWIEALRFVFTNAGVERLKIKKDAVVQITNMCFRLSYHVYDIDGGAAFHGGASGTFNLSTYINNILSKVNCYDQAYAVIVFSGALGVNVDGLFLEPFGYIKTINLVGWGSCNNPFPAWTVSGMDPLVIGATHERRSSFGNHMFCEFEGKIYDACAGPAKGIDDRAGYVSNTIDTVMPSNAPSDYPGRASNITTIARIGASVRNVN